MGLEGKKLELTELELGLLSRDTEKSTRRKKGHFCLPLRSRVGDPQNYTVILMVEGDS
jgi:hypothetical protein